MSGKSRKHYYSLLGSDLEKFVGKGLRLNRIKQFGDTQ